MTDSSVRPGNHVRHQGPGQVLKHTTIDSGVIVQAAHAVARVQVYTPGVIRVQLVAAQEEFSDLSYAVIATPKEAGFTLDDSSKELTLTTSQITVRISKRLLSFSFEDANGKIINQDEPGFGISMMGNDRAVYKTMQKGERFIGLGEKTGNLDRRGTGYTNWNTDSFAYGPGSDPLYCTFPFYIGLHHNLAYGIFLDNTYKSHFNFGASNDRFSSFTVEGGELDYYFIHESTVGGIIESYTMLTGRMEMPPLWSLGYQQCRYSYYPEEEVYSVARTFREKKIPADTIVLDIHYMDEYKIFSWDGQRFPNPKRLLGDLKEQGYQVVVMCDPGIKIESGYEPYEDGLEKEVFIQYPDGTNYSGEVWPGWCHFPDFTNPVTRTWWGAKFQEYVDMGVRGFWNDMNEIATWGQRLPDLMEFDFEGQGGSTKRGRNIYGSLMSRSTYEGTKKLLRGERPFSLTRSAFCGVQRYSAVWTGDNVANDEHMLLGVRLVNSLGLSGVAFTGYDVGGFVGETSTGLFARWISIGAFSPFFRGHTMINSNDSEPWTFGEEVEDISRNYINLRYQLLPYLYSAFFQAVQTGMPLARSLAIDYAFDDKIYEGRYQNQYLFGASFLVAPVESYKDLAKVYLPRGSWYDFHTETLYDGAQEVYVDCPLTELPLFVKAGSIIPMQSIIQTTQESPEPVMHLHLYGKGEGSFDYFEDDGQSYAYQDGAYYQRHISYHPESNILTFSAAEGTYQSKFERIKLYLHGFSKQAALILNENQVPLSTENHVFLPAISNFDPVDKFGEAIGVNVQTAEFENLGDEMRVVLYK